MTDELHRVRRVLRAPLGASIDGEEVTLDGKAAAYRRLVEIAQALRATYNDPSTTPGMREWIVADMENLRDPAAAHILSAGNVKTSGNEVWSTVPFFPSDLDENSVEGIATLANGVEGHALVKRLLGGWSGDAAVVLLQGSGNTPNATYFELTLDSPFAKKLLDRFCSPPERSRVVREIDEAMRAIELAVGGGSLVTATPVRDRGLTILQFHPASADKLASHVELLTHLRANGLLADLDLWKVAPPPGSVHSGLIVLAGSAAAVAGLSRVYHHAAADAFVAERCANDWSLVSATATVSDTPEGGHGVNLPQTEVALEELLNAVRHAESVESIG